MCHGHLCRRHLHDATARCTLRPIAALANPSVQVTASRQLLLVLVRIADETEMGLGFPPIPIPQALPPARESSTRSNVQRGIGWLIDLAQERKSELLIPDLGCHFTRLRRIGRGIFDSDWNARVHVSWCCRHSNTPSNPKWSGFTSFLFLRPTFPPHRRLKNKALECATNGGGRGMLGRSPRLPPVVPKGPRLIKSAHG